jgi:hypothetical protein
MTARTLERMFWYGLASGLLLVVAAIGVAYYVEANLPDGRKIEDVVVGMGSLVGAAVVSGGLFCLFYSRHRYVSNLREFTFDLPVDFHLLGAQEKRNALERSLAREKVLELPGQNSLGGWAGLRVGRHIPSKGLESFRAGFAGLREADLPLVAGFYHTLRGLAIEGYVLTDRGLCFGRVKDDGAGKTGPGRPACPRRFVAWEDIDSFAVRFAPPPAEGLTGQTDADVILRDGGRFSLVTGKKASPILVGLAGQLLHACNPTCVAPPTPALVSTLKRAVDAFFSGGLTALISFLLSLHEELEGVCVIRPVEPKLP